MRFWPRREARTLPAPPVSPYAALMGSQTSGRIAPDRALGIADVFACVRVIAETAASLPLHVYRHTPDGRERVTTGRLARLLDNPAPGVTTSAFVGQIATHLTLRGNAFVGKYRDRDGIAQLGLLSPDAVSVRIENGAPVYTVTRPEGVGDYGPGDILHLRGPLSVDGILGIGPLQADRDAVAAADHLAVFARTFAENAGRPSGIIKTTGGGPVSAEMVSDLRAALDTKHSSPARAGGLAIVGGNVEWTPLSLSLVDAQFIEQRRYSTAEIARIFRVPPWMVGAPSGDSMTYATVAEQARAFTVFTMRPLLVAIEQALSGDRDLSPGGVYAQFNLDGLLRADPKTRAEVYRVALDPTTGWMRRDEVRALEDLPPEKDGPQ